MRKSFPRYRVLPSSKLRATIRTSRNQAIRHYWAYTTATTFIHPELHSTSRYSPKPYHTGLKSTGNVSAFFGVDVLADFLLSAAAQGASPYEKRATAIDTDGRWWSAANASPKLGPKLLARGPDRNDGPATYVPVPDPNDPYAGAGARHVTPSPTPTTMPPPRHTTVSRGSNSDAGVRFPYDSSHGGNARIATPTPTRPSAATTTAAMATTWEG
ncbi:hypothetical protein EDB89DRAFT_1911932 [Lactarius sanguifluus]|nr:hypothetical protein EDB89DRAFT_1911932 [Lactarius sanguifluus]